MDQGLYRASILMLIMGVIGVWLAYYADISESFYELAGISVLMVVLGLLLLPVALFKGGLPRSRSFVPVFFIAAIAFGLIGVPYMMPGQQVEWSGRTVEIYLIANEWNFNGTNPTITVNLGDKVIIRILNNGSAPHQFEVVGLEGSLSEVFKGGEEVVVEFIASKTGEFTYLCPIPGHAEQGMSGTFIVLPPEET